MPSIDVHHKYYLHAHQSYWYLTNSFETSSDSVPLYVPLASILCCILTLLLLLPYAKYANKNEMAKPKQIMFCQCLFLFCFKLCIIDEFNANIKWSNKKWHRMQKRNDRRRTREKDKKNTHTHRTEAWICVPFLCAWESIGCWAYFVFFSLLLSFIVFPRWWWLFNIFVCCAVSCMYRFGSGFVVFILFVYTLSIEQFLGHLLYTCHAIHKLKTHQCVIYQILWEIYFAAIFFFIFSFFMNGWIFRLFNKFTKHMA